MCGRFTLTIEISELQRALSLGYYEGKISPRFNIAPGQAISIVKDPDTRSIERMHWGLIPSWARDENIGYKMINARSETVHEKPAFRDAFQKRRCLILADGFFEWKKDDRDKKTKPIPYYFHIDNHEPFMFAWLWEFWNPSPEKRIYSCTIITCKANQAVATIHDRMPVILDKNSSWRWLGGETSDHLRSLLIPFPSDRITVRPVSRLVNSPKNDSPEVLHHFEVE